MRFFDKSISIVAVLFLTACGGGGGGSTPLELTVASFTEFKLFENSSGAWPIEASVNKSGSLITHSISGGPDLAAFSISGNILSFVGSANYEAPSDSNKDGVYEVYVQTSSGSASSSQTIYIKVTDVPESPVISTQTISSQPENSLTIATISANDEDLNSTLTFSFFDSGSAKDEALLAIDSSSGTVTFLTAPNFEIPTDLNSDNTIDFSVVVSDGTLSAQADYSFIITNVSEAPVISGASFSASENQATVGTIGAIDPDAGSSLMYSLVSDSTAVDETLFSINPSTGAVSFLSPPDFESPVDTGADNIYNFSVNVSDGSLSSVEAFAVTVTNVNEGPSWPSINSQLTFTENGSGGISVAASDPDSSSLSYALVGGRDADKFYISSTGILTFISIPDYEAPSDGSQNNFFDLTIQVTDGSLSSSVSLQIVVLDDTADNFGIRLPSKVAIAELKKES